MPTVAHGDLIPANIVVCGGKLYLVDFEYCHLGCLYTDIGKWFAQGGFIGGKPTRLVAEHIEAIHQNAGAQLDMRAVAGSALAWLADYRWVVTAARRGRSDILHYRDVDLERLQSPHIHDQITELAHFHPQSRARK
jgi:thiamine kinase-like enzyme